MSKALWLVWMSLLLAGCTNAAQAPAAAAATKDTSTQPVPPHARTVATQLDGQRGSGAPYELVGTEVWDVPDPVSGRTYQVFVALPAGYADHPERRYPVLYATDADYAFPVARQIARRLNGEGPAIDDFILVGLSYALGDAPMPSRRRDYTPTTEDGDAAAAGATHGHAGAYIAYLRDQVLPFVAQRYRTDEARRLFLGHSYGGLLGTQILLSTPELFSGYILGSPSYWFGAHAMRAEEARFASSHRDLPAQVYLYVGEYEQRRYGKHYDMVTDAQQMVQTLRGRHYPSLRVQLDVLADEDHLSVAPRGLTHGLKFLLGAPPQ
ncbi:alpha/beta hydrolase [Xanthomonas sp. A2111]|uniref:Alpha/beta hydrolase-fold protein n=1 Tax=Xanthomonas hawaiiensis TaxID=3003247 RepID=A0ABU2I3R5_9XANT|nr:alpha/beta hydrolase-fold protein [Xanthomonas sp. A2111]MBO9830576.1 alpha/beta hydrolase [Xanthomonas sp. A2111]MDS9992781.1 alpha/beta hydrolase-fold protein [Xanthomonas sp. A2111]